MAKRRGNPNWGKPEPIGPIIPTEYIPEPLLEAWGFEIESTL